MLFLTCKPPTLHIPVKSHPSTTLLAWANAPSAKASVKTNPQKGAVTGIEDAIWKSTPRAIFDDLAKRYQKVYFKRFFRAFGISVEMDWPAQLILAIDKIVQRRKMVVDEEQKRPDLLQHLVDEGTNPSNEKKMSTRQIVDQMSEIVVAGSETTSGTIACLFLEIARNPKSRRNCWLVS
ncbi:hypothetical protein VTL71DRAFT_8591 [Oculimacula yallundae]|uniref:Cytochrome P450 n=1 Tax=Oculimacula yallundae TaxID=86028 RepID=A0ABR4CY68_9HELO